MKYPDLIAIGIAIFVAAAGTAEAKLFELEDFSWGLPLLEIELRAADHGYRLRDKDISQPEPRLEYQAFLHGEECRVLFSFTPLTGKLYAVTAAWDSSEFGEFLRRKLTTDLGEPREEIPGAGISIWTRRNTELTLRSGHGRTTLTYCHLLLKQDAREEKKVLQEKTKMERERRSARFPEEEEGETGSGN